MSGVVVRGFKEFANDLKRADSWVSREFGKAVGVSLQYIQNEARQRAGGPPIVFTGYMARNLKVIHNQPLRGVVYAGAKYSPGVEYGTGPHLVPIEQLRRWARLKLKDESAAYPIQKKILRRGTDKHPWFYPAVEDSLLFIKRRFEKSLDGLTRMLAGK